MVACCKSSNNKNIIKKRVTHFSSFKISCNGVSLGPRLISGGGDLHLKGSMHYSIHGIRFSKQTKRASRTVSPSNQKNPIHSYTRLSNSILIGRRRRMWEVLQDPCSFSYTRAQQDVRAVESISGSNYMDIPARVEYTLPKQSTVRQIHAVCYGKQLTDPSTEKKRRPEIQFALEGGGDNKTKQHDIKMLLTFLWYCHFTRVRPHTLHSLLQQLRRCRFGYGD